MGKTKNFTGITKAREYLLQEITKDLKQKSIEAIEIRKKPGEIHYRTESDKGLLEIRKFKF